MTRNLSNADRAIRVAIAIAAVAGAFVLGFTSVAGIVLIVVGVVMAGTAAVGFCPLYRVLGLSTCPVPARR